MLCRSGRWVFFVWLFEALSHTHTNNNNNKMAPVWYCTVGYCTVYIHERSKYHKIQKKAGKLMMMMMRGWLSMLRCQNMGILEMTKINIF